MNKAEFFLAACKAGLYRKQDWVISAFAQIQEGPDEWKEDPYPYRIVQQRSGVFYVDPEDPTKLSKIEDIGPSSAWWAPYQASETLVLKRDPELALYQDNLRTTYGNLLWNFVMIIYPFAGKIAYVNKRINPGQLESMILARFAPDPQGGVQTPASGYGEASQKDPIYVSEYLKAVEAASYLTGFTQLFVPGDTEKTITPPPGLVEFRAKLLEKYKDQLHDPAVIALIDEALVQFDSEYLKGDEGEGFLISGKSRNIVRRKLYLSTGAEPGLDDDVSVDHIPTALSEGWDISKFNIYQDTQRAGSFNRSAQTELGGESVKWLLRASSNLKIAAEDCGTRLGMPTTFDEKIFKNLIGFSVVTPNGHEVIREEDKGKYLGKTMMRRSPQFCKMEKTDFCRLCAGPRLALNETALFTSVTNIGSTIMLIFMKAAHSTGLSLAHMDITKELR